MVGNRARRLTAVAVSGLVGFGPRTAVPAHAVPGDVRDDLSSRPVTKRAVGA
ncbi:hypothetical protein KIPE111705_33950 [Kibdelosporangium persicum]